MASNLETRNGVVSFVENGKTERAWHRLGKVFDGMLTTTEALQESGANFKVEGRDMFYMTSELQQLMESGQDIPASVLQEQLKKIARFQTNVRTDYEESLGVVSSSYGIVQNADAFNFIDVLTSGSITAERGITPVIESAGVLGHGERIFITAKFPEAIKVANNDNDLIDMNIVFTTSHDGTGAVQCMVTPVRVVCNNTLNLAMKDNRGKLSLRHTAHVNGKLDLTNKENAELAYRTLNLYDVYKKSFEQQLLELAQIKVNDKQLEEILAKSLLSDENFDLYIKSGKNLGCDDISTRGRNLVYGALEATHSGVGQDILDAGTGLWVVNGLTTYYQNNKRWTDNDKMFTSITSGDAQDKLQKTYESVLALA